MHTQALLDIETTDTPADFEDVFASDGNFSALPRRSFVLPLAISIVLLLLIAAWQAPSASAPPSDNTVQVTLGDIQTLVAATAKLEPVEWVDVGAQVSGQLTSLNVGVGDQVSRGDLLARIDASVQNNLVLASQANLEMERAQLAARTATLNMAEAHLQRQMELKEQSLTSKQELQNATTQAIIAKSEKDQVLARITRSEASLASDVAQLRYSSIFAPINGVVIALEANVGQTLNATQRVPKILRLADMSAMTVRADVSEADIIRLRTAHRAYFTTLGGGSRRWAGTVEQILPSPTIRSGVVLYPVLFTVDNQDGTLLPEMTAQVTFITGEVNNVTIVPSTAVSDIDDNTGIVKVTTASGTENRKVTLGLTDRINVQVVEGLSVGETLILPPGLQ